MLFRPNAKQVQALRIARRFQRGFRPTFAWGKLVAPDSLLSTIKFYSVPAFVLGAEIGRSTEFGDLIDELCQRGYFEAHEGYPACVHAPMEYVTEDGTKVRVHDKYWGQIDVLPPNARHMRCHIGGFSGRVQFGQGAATPRGKQEPETVGKGSCYELTPKGFDLLDQVEAGDEIDPDQVDELKPSHRRAKQIYEWAMGHIDGAENMTYAELFEELADNPLCGGEGLPSNPATFARYCRGAGIRRNTSRAKKGTTRNVRRISEL